MIINLSNGKTVTVDKDKPYPNVKAAAIEWLQQYRKENNMDRKDITLHVKGRRDCIACIEGIEYENGYVSVNSERDHITENAFRKAIEVKWPNNSFVIEKQDFDFVAYGGQKCTT